MSASQTVRWLPLLLHTSAYVSFSDRIRQHTSASETMRWLPLLLHTLAYVSFSDRIRQQMSAYASIRAADTGRMSASQTVR